MCRKMKKWIWVGVCAVLAGVLGGIAYHQATPRSHAVTCVTVNGTPITHEEIDIAYNQQKNGVTPVTREQVIDATVRNTVVRDYGQANGIAVTKAELDTLIKDYQATGYYDSAVELYGEAGLRQGLYNHELFIRTRDYILTEKVTVPAVTQADIAAFLAENRLETMTLTDKQREDIIYTLTKSKREDAYAAFVDELMKTAEILYH